MSKPNNQPSAADIRRKELAAIHAAKRDLGMDEDVYRDLLNDIAGVRSAALLNSQGRQAVISRMRELGFKRKTKQQVASHPGKPRNLNNKAELQKIEALLAEMKLPWSYADAIAMRQFGIEKVSWIKKADQFRAIIAALHVEHEKRSLLVTLTDLTDQAGVRLDELADQLQLKGNWQRNRRTLKRLIQFYAESQ